MIKRSNGKMTYFGAEMTKEQLADRIGDMSQVAGIRLFELMNGNERGVRAAEFYTGTGFTFTVLLDRGMDIDQAKFGSIPVSWESPTGPVSPAFYESKGLEWLRQFQGGLLAGCGPTYFGAPNVDEGTELGLHGRLSNIPAKDVCVKQEWKGNDYVMYVEGHMNEAATFLDSLRVSRRVETMMGESRLFVHDVVENIGFARSPFCILYHCNMGWPIVSENSRLYLKSQVRGRGSLPAADVSKWNVFQSPTKGFAEHVFYHTVEADKEGMASAALINPAFGGGEGFGVYVRWNKDTLPYMVEWKMMGQKAYVVGLEPSNATGDGRAANRKEGTLRFLEPGEKAESKLEIGLLANKAEIDDWLKKNA